MNNLLELLQKSKSITYSKTDLSGLTPEIILQNLEFCNPDDKIGIQTSDGKVHSIKSITYSGDLECFVLVIDEKNIYSSVSKSKTIEESK